MIIAKQKLQEMYDRDVKSLDSSAKDRILRLEAEHRTQIEAIEHKYTTQIEILKKESELKYSSMKQVSFSLCYSPLFRLT